MVGDIWCISILAWAAVHWRTESVYNKIRPIQEQLARFYGLPKIRRVHTPIVSCVNTFAYDLSYYPADVLSPLPKKSEHTVHKCNSAHFISTINNERVLESEIMLSFKEESLFTNVPIQVAAQAVLGKLGANPSLANHTILTPKQTADHLNLVVRSIYFYDDRSFYEQQEGAAMGR